MVQVVDDPTSTDEVEPRLREILGGAAAFRIFAVGWTVAIVTIDARSGVLENRAVAITVLAALAAWTSVVAVWARLTPRRLLAPPTIAFDMLLAAATVATDSAVYRGSHPQSFGSVWPAAAVVSTAAILGWIPGLLAGAGIGVVNFASAAIAGRVDGRYLALSGTLVLLATTGAVAGYVAGRLRRAESEIARARAREEFARTLHDGVLQSLAVIQRRSDDPSLIELAREQERELRDFVTHGARETGDLIAAIRQSATLAERDHDIRVEVVVIEAPTVSAAAQAALAGAVSEAIANAAKHSGAATVTVSVDRNEGAGTVVSVHDDGCGFDVDAPTSGTGLARSIRARIDQVNGTVSIRSSPQRGTEVTMWTP